MEQKKFWLLVMVLFLGFSSLANGFSLKPSSEECQVQPSARMNCGYPYISAQECYNRGCCFDSSIVGVIWCFFPDHSANPALNKTKCCCKQNPYYFASHCQLNIYYSYDMHLVVFKDQPNKMFHLK